MSLSVTDEHECCWHMAEVLPSVPPQVRERCCWCNARRTVPYAPPEVAHGLYIYRTAPITTRVD